MRLMTSSRHTICSLAIVGACLMLLQTATAATTTSNFADDAEKLRNVKEDKTSKKAGASVRATTSASSTSRSKRSSERGSSDNKAMDELFDTNMDGVNDIEDLIFLLRAIADPLKEITPGIPSADVNQDGVVDLLDAANATAYLANLLGQDALGETTPDLFFPENPDAQFPWFQPEGRRRSLDAVDSSKGDLVATHSFLEQHHDRQLQQPDDDTCGAELALFFAKGDGPKPTITWDTQNCVFDQNIKLGRIAYLQAYASWAIYENLALTAFVAGQTDAARAYFHYRRASGKELSVDYEKAIREDSTIRRFVDQEIAAVEAAAKQMLDSSQSLNFKFHSATTRSVPNGNTNNWRRTVGGHQIWSEGEVTYDANVCALKIDFNIRVEDYYNFNPGQSDIGSGLPDNSNCLFSQLGWAKGFYSRGSITRSSTVALDCCKDEDCVSIESSKCDCNRCVATCPTEQRSGGQGFTSFSVELFQNQGTFEVSYELYTIKDELNIFYEGVKVYSTGGLVSGGATASVRYGSASSKSTVITVEINAPTEGTVWDVSVRCPAAL